MLQILWWEFDTCSTPNCIAGEIYDDSLDEDDKQDGRTYGTIVARCPTPSHLRIEEPKNLYEALVEEQHRKNWIFELAKFYDTDLTQEDYSWRFSDRTTPDGARILICNFKGMTDRQKDQLRANMKFERNPGEVVWDGAGKIVVE